MSADETQSLSRILYELATAFRRALLDCPKDCFSSFQRRQLAKFPTESCDVASLLLAYYLRDRGFRAVKRVCGFHKIEQGKSHVWLEVNGMIVDITPSQFPDVEDQIVVTEATRQSWHYSTFHVQSREPAYSVPKVTEEYERAYAAIKQWLALDSSLKSSCP